MPKSAHEWRNLDCGGRSIRLLVHNAGKGGDRAIVYFHGGGWIVGSPATHADISEAIAATTGLPVISVDYRLAPEFAAEAAVADGLAVLRQVVDHYGSVLTCGDSAGGSIALAVAQAAALGPGLLGAASLYGCFGLTANAALYRDPSISDGLDAASVRRYWLAANRSGGASPYAIPSLAHREGCPVYLLAAGRDPLCADSLVLARTLREKGRPITLDLHPYAAHSFLQDPHARRARSLAFEHLAQWIDALTCPGKFGTSSAAFHGDRRKSNEGVWFHERSGHWPDRPDDGSLHH